MRKIALALAAMSLITSGYTMRGAEAQVQSAFNCNQPFDPYQVSSLVRTQCGVRTFPMITSKSLYGGGTEYIYSVEGVTTVYKVPPPGLDPLSATADQLRLYGLPDRPSDGAGLLSWQSMMRHQHLIAPPPFLAESPFVASSITASWWSGQMAVSSFNQYDFTEAIWTEEQTYSTSCSPNAVAVWTGLGGWYTGNLAQDGTAYNVSGLGNHQSWYEVLPASPVAIPDIYGYPGWNFTAETEWQGNGFYFYVYDSKYGDAWNGTIFTSSYDGRTADFIVERPKSNGVRTWLTDFSPVTFHHGYVNGVSPYYEVGTWPNDTISMYNNTDLLAYPSGMENTDPIFKDNFNSCA